MKTAQGSFRVSLGEIPYGKSVKLLDGRVMADRVPPSYQITNTPDEQDYPALAADGTEICGSRTSNSGTTRSTTGFGIPIPSAPRTSTT